MIQRKLSIQRVHTETDCEETQIPDDNDHPMPVKANKKSSKFDKEENHEESKASVNEDEAGDGTEDTEMADGDKDDTEEAQSPQNITEKDSLSNTVSGIDDSPQEASGSSKRLRMYKCERCNSQYMGLAMLRQHCRDVHGDQKYYKCHVCGKLFSHPSSRNIHLRLHSGEKPYKCSTCGKQFRVSSHLKDHVRVHTGERPYICDICHKGFKQSSDLKKHRRTHTLDKPYKCPICPSAFTRSHHCRGHINSVHKFFKCVACSALFTSEEAFERHKEFHPSVFPDHAVHEQRTLSNGVVTGQSAVSSQKSERGEKGKTEKDHEMHEKNLKLDVANQLLELHKVMQQRPLPSSTPGSGSETMSDSGDEASLTHKQSPSTGQSMPVKPQPAAAVSPSLTHQERANRPLPTMGHVEHLSAISPEMVSEGVRFQVPQSLQVRYCHSPQPNPQGQDYLRLPFQYSSYGGNKKSSYSATEMPGHVSFSSSEVQTSQLVNGYLPAVNGAPQRMSHSPENGDPPRQRKNYNNFGENSLRGENVLQDNSVVTNAADSTNSVPCHRVSVIQYHSSSQKSSNDGRDEESMIKVASQEAAKTLENETCDDDQLQNQEGRVKNYSLMNDIKYFARIPQELIPYLPLTAERSIALQQLWNKEIDDHAAEYTWALKEAKRLKMLSDQGGQFPPANHILENGQRNMFSQASANMYNAASPSLQERSVDRLKFLAREHIKVKDVGREAQSPSGGDDSETSETSESGDALNGGKAFGNSGQQSPSSESLDHRASPESSIHHCQVCKKTFSRSSLLKQHAVIHMGNKRFKFRCEVCGKMFRTRSHLRDHTRIHTGERPFKCHICQKAFKQSSDLKKHINLHTGANQFKCEECNMEFRRADALRKHKLGHKVGNMPCGHCGKNFLHIGALRAHRAMHNVQPVKASRSFHRCNYCFKTFTKAESYKIHIEAHTREQNGTVVPFDCKICSMKFFTEAEFQDHMNIHNGKRPYKCFVCDKEFCIAEHLQDHVRLHSDVSSRHRCEEDGNNFQRPDDLIRHSAIHA